MSRQDDAGVPRRLATWLIVGIALAVVLLAWFGYQATREWRRSSSLLAQRRAEQAADFLVRALLRDMRGVDDSILRALHWDEITLDPPYEISDLAASAFARYPYPEAFFAWANGAAADDVVFFTRADRRPPWLENADRPGRYPVTVVRGSASTQWLVDRLGPVAAQGHRFAAFETRLGGQPYQIVARLLYRDTRRDRLERVFGFVVNLDWVRRSYFPELTREVARIAADADLQLAILDDRGALVAGSPTKAHSGPVIARPLRPLFFDSALLALESPDDLPVHEWTVQVSARPELGGSPLSANETLAATGVAAAGLCVGLVLTARALRARADLTKLRSDFVASVTHELKTPLATIRAASETLVRRRVSTAEQVEEYARLLDQESKRLTRLVENLLAYSRVTDVSEVYSFTAVAPADLVDDILRAYQPQFAHHGFEVVIDIPADLPAVRADRATLGLALDNVIDNAILYSGDRRWIEVRARQEGRMVQIRVRDRGVGIPADELPRVARRFVRGRQARSHGSGLGLAIAGRVMDDHRGQLLIESAAGDGTTVTLTLPIARAEDLTP